MGKEGVKNTSGRKLEFLYLNRLLLHLGGESETSQNSAGFRLGFIRSDVAQFVAHLKFYLNQLKIIKPSFPLPPVEFQVYFLIS